MKKIINCVLVCLLVLTSCSNSGSVKSFEYSFEDLLPFIKDSSIHLDDATTMNYCQKLNEFHQYGTNFSFKFKELGSDIKAVVIYADGKFSRMDNKCQIVCTIDKEGKNVSWNGLSFSDFITQPNTWTEVLARYDISQFNAPENIINIYPWCDGKGDVYIDNLRIEFER